ncbi:MAG: L-rhamnose mutarotase [Terracidiphilus sp.]
MVYLGGGLKSGAAASAGWNPSISKGGQLVSPGTNSAADQPLKRYAFMLCLRPGAAEAYEEAHRAVWPEMLALLKSAGIREYSIYRRDELLILALRTTDFEATWSRIENDPVNLRWQQAMAPFFAPHERLRPGERFPMMEEVFYLP